MAWTQERGNIARILGACALTAAVTACSSEALKSVTAKHTPGGTALPQGAPPPPAATPTPTAPPPAGAATAVVPVTLSQLAALAPQCATNADFGTVACNTGIDQFCAAAGYATGFGPLDFNGTNAKVACVAMADAAVVKTWTLSKLAQTYNQPACTQDHGFSLPCLAAIGQACTAAGYIGGWGPTALQGDNATFFCSKAASATAAVVVTQAFDAARFYDNPGCDTPLAPLAPSCLSAVHHGCETLGYLTGYGPVAYTGATDSGATVCLGPARTPPRPTLAAVVPALASFNAPASEVAMKYKHALATDNPAEPGQPQVYTRPLGALTFSRRSNNNGTAPCNAADACFGLTSATINLATGGVTDTTDLFLPGPGGTVVGDAVVPTGTLITAYDPFSLAYNGQIWVAFECSGTVTDNTFSACMGVYDPVTKSIPAASIYVLVEGVSTPAPLLVDGVTVQVTYTASVPKLLRHRGHVYLYWSSITVGPPTVTAAGAPTFNFLSVQGRGIELKVDADNANRLLPVDASGAFLTGHLHALDSATVAVFAPPDPRGAADISDVVSDGTNIYALSSIGNVNGCTSPYDTAATTIPPLKNPPITAAAWPLQCYDIAVSVGTTPLTAGTFAGYKIIVPESAGYARFFALEPESGASDLLGIIANFSWEPMLTNLPSDNSLIPLPLCTSASVPAC